MFYGLESSVRLTRLILKSTEDTGAEPVCVKRSCPGAAVYYKLNTVSVCIQAGKSLLLQRNEL